MPSKQDSESLRVLASELAEIAALPIQEEKRSMWRTLNSLGSVRPLVMVDQVCWNEMNVNNELTLRCEDSECRGYETRLRRTLFQWHHFPVDMVVEPFLSVPKAIRSTGFGVTVHESTASTDEANDVVSHEYVNQFQCEEDLDKLQVPQISHDIPETERRLEFAHTVFDGTLEVRAVGCDPFLSLWDPISTWMGIQNALLALIDEPEFMHRLVGKMTDGYLSMLDQLEEQALLCQPQSLIHCTGAYTDELPVEGYNADSPRTKDIWMFGLAQMFSSCSPAMFKEFEVDYASKICERFGLVYYGCCDPLDHMMKEVRQIPNVRKVSMSPWVNQRRGAEEIHGDFVFSRKPNPALIASESFDPEVIRKDLTFTRQVCEENNCPLEMIQKDISTVRHDPKRLFDWAKVAMEVANA